MEKYNAFEELRKLDEELLNEMAMSRADAIDRCISLGKKFLEHFHKVYTEPNAQSVNHWVNDEMRVWYGDAKTIRLKPNNKSVSVTMLNDCFFTCGAEPTDFVPMTDEELSDYEKFYIALDRGIDIVDAFKEIIPNINL
ncbi:MAG: hypothetical protein IJM79_01200 [Erysipelotrichaceae bacterium]|nr:hypothetical protein [Erysipelotrichaceae bacterium]